MRGYRVYEPRFGSTVQIAQGTYAQATARFKNAVEQIVGPESRRVGMFRIKPGAAKVALIRAAASTQTLGDTKEGA